MFRRFDAVIDYPLPTPPVVKELIRNRLANVSLDRIVWKRVTDTAEGLSHSEITLAAEQAAKDIILTKVPKVTTARLVDALKERQAHSQSQ
jgi:hypothetical protein